MSDSLPVPEAEFRTAAPAFAGGAPLQQRFRENLQELIGDDARPVLVACSGGCDSVVLLHLLRFHAADLVPRVAAAHLDHAMRAGSDTDAQWVAGLCRAWGVPLTAERALVPPRSEADARALRYAFLRRAAGPEQTWIATAHHADDQAETVLFRVFRGTGIGGLRGIPARGAGGLLRPLLPFWREELRRYARAAGLRWRADPTNRSASVARNRLRLDVIPYVEQHIAPAARRGLVRLAAAAAEAEAAREPGQRQMEAECVRYQEDAVLLARNSLRMYDSAAVAGMLRSVLGRLGLVLDRAGTRSAVQFITHAPSGRELHLPGGVRVRTEFDTARIDRPVAAAPDVPLRIDARGAQEHCEGTALIGGRCYAVAWAWASRGATTPELAEGGVLLDAGIRFPLALRGWVPGDRIRTRGGTRPLKKIFGEHRVPRSLRAAVPVLADADGTVLWVRNLAQAEAVVPQAGGPVFRLTVTDESKR